ncbi:MAG: DUF885 domain-containing protein [Chitinophagaceae bacterium]
MKKILFVVGIVTCLLSCNQPSAGGAAGNASFDSLLDTYYETRLKLYPLEGTFVGDKRYNDTLINDGSQNFVNSVTRLCNDYLVKLSAFRDAKLSDEQKLSYDILSYQLTTMQQGFKLDIFYDLANFAHPLFTPFNQMVSLPLTIGQMASGTGLQPFKSVSDYDNWLKRIRGFRSWSDTAISNMNKGIRSGIVLPKAVVLKMIPQMESMKVDSPQLSIFYGPITNMPAGFPEADKIRLTEEYKIAITDIVVPVYGRLAQYLQTTYLPAARSSSGMSALPGGAELYKFMVMQNTTTSKTPEEIYQTGLSEVERIKKKMDSIRVGVGFRGNMKAFFESMKTGKRFMPYKTTQEVLAAFDSIHKRMEPQLKKLFSHAPRTGFEIRQTEPFRAASASAEYNQGSADGSRPGIFYIPILNAKEFNTTSGMESLFLHEAIPGHHYQISLTQENNDLPKFRRYGIDNAYVEGWALYCESLGKELGLYTDPYQVMGALGDEMHRAIRLVVDVAIHTKGMSREQAIRYMMGNEAISLQGATAEIERYMSNPGQALGYKIGALKIRELRTIAEKQLGSKFDVADFHHEILKDGSMPLAILEAKILKWIASK